MFFLQMCIEASAHVNPALTGPQWLPLSRCDAFTPPGSADVWSRCAAAVAPAGPDGRPIHTSARYHLWSRLGYNPQRAHGSQSAAAALRGGGPCLRLVGICASGTWTASRCSTKGPRTRPAWWAQVSDQQIWAVPTFLYYFLQKDSIFARIFCVIYAQILFHVRVIYAPVLFHVCLLKLNSVLFSLNHRIWILKLLYLHKCCTKRG